MQRIHFTTFILLGTILISGGCGSAKNDQPQEPPPLQTAPANGSDAKSNNRPGSASSSPEVVDIEGVKFTIPAGWKRVDLMPAQAGIISARYLIPVDDSELQLTFTTASGGIAANFDRWQGQFELEAGTEPIEDRITLPDGEALWIDLRGTYRAGGSGFSSPDPVAGTRMIGVGIPLGEQEMYLKLLGPADQVAKIADQMRELVKSADLP
ncbi:MAG: hypothetical protein HUJ26_18580 [Planctomycetaceae bacterium]|nr:hypothetical protein [Planctomycetaceae bacterium]